MSKVAIQYIGDHGIREIDDYRWTPENDHVQEVDVETAADLIAYPLPDQFRVAPGQPLPTVAVLKKLADLLGVDVADVKALFGPAVPAPKPKLVDLPGLSEQRAAELAEQGVKSVAALAALNEKGIAELASKVGASRGEIEAWVAAAAAK